MRRAPVLLVLLSAFLVGCPGPIVNTVRPAPLDSLRVRPGTTLFIADVGTAVPGKSGTDPRMRSMQRRLHGLLARDGTAAASEREVGGVPGVGSYILRLEIADWREDIHNPPELGACWMLAVITVGIGYLPCAGTRTSTDHEIEIEARLYDAAGAELRRVAEAGTGEIELRVDTSARAPILRRTYVIQMRTGIGAGGSQADHERFEREQGERIAELLYQSAARDIEGAIERAAAAPPQVIQGAPATSGDEIFTH